MQVKTCLCLTTALGLVLASGQGSADATGGGVKNQSAPAGVLPDETLQEPLEGTGLKLHFANANTGTIYKDNGSGEVEGLPVRTASAAEMQADVARVAQTAPLATVGAADNDSMQEIVVTARKRDETIQTVPLSLTAVTGAQLKLQSITTVFDLQQQVPSLFIQPAYDDPNSIVVTLRGRKQDDATLATDASISFSVDGINVPRTLGMQGEFLDLNRVEVLRGPQGTLYGRNATGGAIAVYTNDPTDKLEGSLDVTGGNYGAWDLVGIANVPLIGDTLDARFVAEDGGHGGYAHNSTGSPLSWERSQNFRAKLRWKVNDSWNAVFGTHYEMSKAGPFESNLSGLTPANFNNNGLPEGGLLALEEQAETGLPLDQAVARLRSFVGNDHYSLNNNTSNPLLPAISSMSPFSHTARWDVGLNVNGRLSDDLKFRSITGFQHLIRDELISSQTAVTPFVTTYGTSDNYVSQEFQLLGGMQSFNWVAGLYGGMERGEDDTSVNFAPALVGPNVIINNSGIRNSTVAAFAQATWEFIPSWHLTAGGRFTRDTRAIIANDYLAPLFSGPATMSPQYCVVPAPGVELSFTKSQCPREFSTTFTKPTWLVSLDHQLTENILLYAKVATGYRSGGQNAGGAVEAETFATVKPESNLEYEVGFKSEFFDHRLRINVDGYHDKYTNLQISTGQLLADGTVGTIITNAATAEIQGMEAETDLIVLRGLTVHAGTAFTDAHFVHFVDFTGDRTHEPFSVPRWTVSLSGKDVQPTSLGDLLFELDYDWKSTTVLDGKAVLQSQVTQPAYGLLNGRINLHVNALDLDVAAFGKNITNKKYWAQALSEESLGLNLTDRGAPATFGVEVIKHFGR
jgi:iron complex outermembrane receptor protein